MIHFRMSITERTQMFSNFNFRLEIKSITSKTMQYIQDVMQSGLLCNVTGVNYYLSSNQTKYLPQTLRPIVYVSENFHRKFAIRLGPTTDGTTKRLVNCKAHLVF